MKKEVKEKLKKVPGLQTTVRFLKNRVIDFQSILHLLEERKKHRKDGPIRVGFLCQYLPAWSRVEGIYCLMRKDPRFEPYILCVPSGITAHKLNKPESLENDTYEYFCRNGYSEALNLLTGPETWLDLSVLELSYIFYPRPYNAFMPECYTSANVSKMCRICIVMYGIEFSEQISRTTLNRDFMSHAYFYFAELPFMSKINIRNNWISHRLGFQRTMCLGYPMMEQLTKLRNANSPSWDFSQNTFRVLWTPRWTTDPAVGGTNFFLYYKRILEYAQEHPEIDFLLRPHPLAFSNFVKMGDMTEAEVELYKHQCEQIPNVSLDKEAAYEATMWKSSVLISDISGMMPEYFFTGKPLIYCASNMTLGLAEPTRHMLDGCYIVNNEKELFSCVEMLHRGEDPLQEKRLKIRDELFGSWGENICQNILDAVAEDYLKE